MQVKIESFATPLDATIAAQKNEQFTTGGGTGNTYNIAAASVGVISGQMGVTVPVPAGSEVDVLTMAGAFTGGKPALILGYISVTGSGLNYALKFYVNGVLESTTPVTSALANWGFILNPTTAGAATIKMSVNNIGAGAMVTTAGSLSSMEFI